MANLDHTNAPLKSLLIATAGHVDHGKSTLVRQLTGIDPDRWPEEKARGLTLDLGYAFTQKDGCHYAFIDVPGHEKFAHNMLAGIGAIDAALLVIAADESIMPQTREHALAFRYLGIEQIGLVFSKADLVTEDLFELLELEVEEWLETLGWSEVPRVRFSSKQPKDSDAVFTMLRSFSPTPKRKEGPARLSIDRVFTRSGSGTVLTGTVACGCFHRESEVRIGQLKGRIRNLEIHGAPALVAEPHSRVALNLSGVHFSHLKRGNLVSSGYQPEASRKVLLRLQVFAPNWAPTPKHQVHLFHLAARLLARMLWRENDVACFELDQAYPFWALDRGLIRDGSPLRLCGGFEVLHPNPTQPKRRHVRPLLTNLPARGDLAQWQCWRLEQEHSIFDANHYLNGCGSPLLAEPTKRTLPLGNGNMVARKRWAFFSQDFEQEIKRQHAQHPLYDWLPFSLAHAWAQRTHIDANLYTKLLESARTEWLEIDGERCRRSNYRSRWREPDLKLLAIFLQPLQNPLPVIDLKSFKQERPRFATLERLLTWERFLINISPTLLIHYAYLNRIVALLHKKYAYATFSIQELKQEFQITRKVAIPLLEYFDKQAYTRREEDRRRWITKEAPHFSSTWASPLG